MLRNIFFRLREKMPRFFGIGATSFYGYVLVNLDIVRNTCLNALIIQHVFNAVVGLKR